MIAGIKSAVWIAGTLMTAIGALIGLYPHVFLGLFHPSERVMDLATRSIRIAMVAYPLVIAQIMINSFFVATGHSLFGTATNLTRSVVVRIPAAYFFAWYLGEKGVWWFQPFSWLSSGFVAWYGFARVLKAIKKPGPQALASSGVSESR
ncbi:MAG: hypothetical protein LBR71_02550, partial [Synergistaceae bacterium]|jgi:Na+-driven multidrug efflux pump|nr:hypothetical protein [Synergistaceae bacterium]